MNSLIDPLKFKDPHITAKGEPRATVTFKSLTTVWLNSGSLCNIECANCYIKSSPTADHFVYLTPDDVRPFLDEIATLTQANKNQGPVEIGVTGGEPFLNPSMIEISQMALSRGHSLLILTNAMKPMMRPRVQAGLLDLKARYGDVLTLRVSLDHFTQIGHDRERGAGSFEIAMKGLDWLQSHGFKTHIAGRAAFAESVDEARLGYAALFAQKGCEIEAHNPSELVLFPEMDETVDVPEITTACWGILDVHPDTMMCASSRMVVKRKGAERAAVLACTLLWDDPQFELGETLTESLRPVSLNHPHCSRFCVLGGASCAA